MKTIDKFKDIKTKDEFERKLAMINIEKDKLVNKTTQIAKQIKAIDIVQKIANKERADEFVVAFEKFHNMLEYNYQINLRILELCFPDEVKTPNGLSSRQYVENSLKNDIKVIDEQILKRNTYLTERNQHLKDLDGSITDKAFLKYDKKLMNLKNKMLKTLIKLS